MRKLVVLAGAVVAAVFVLAAPAGAVPATNPVGVIAGVESATLALNQSAAALLTKGKKRKPLTAGGVVKHTQKSLDNFVKEKFTGSLKGELGVLGKAFKRYDKKLGGQLEALGLGAEESDLRAAYEASISRVEIHLTASLQVGRRSLRNKRGGLGKKLDKAEKALTAARNAQSIATTLKQLKKAFNLLKAQVAAYQESLVGRRAAWVIDSLALAPAGEGVDLDGDGEVDNDLAGLLTLVEGLRSGTTAEINAELASRVMDGTPPIDVPIIEMWGFSGYEEDASVNAGLGLGRDCDDSARDNYTGTEPFDVTNSTAVDGYPVLRAPTAFGPDGTYEFTATGQNVEIFTGISLPGDAPFGLAGQAQADSNDGLIGFVIPLTALRELVLAALDIDPDGSLTIRERAIVAGLDAGLPRLATIDLDGDSTPDAIPAALAFTSVSCTLAECARR